MVLVMAFESLGCRKGWSSAAKWELQAVSQKIARTITWVRGGCSRNSVSAPHPKPSKQHQLWSRHPPAFWSPTHVPLLVSGQTTPSMPPGFYVLICTMQHPCQRVNGDIAAQYRGSALSGVRQPQEEGFPALLVNTCLFLMSRLSNSVHVNTVILNPNGLLI